ncbi:MAG: hypothetical protein WDZ93_03165 [Candidatus Paceibacterota bacterium]
MQIPYQLPQFNRQNVLMVVMGSQRGLLYLAADGMVDIIGTIEQPADRYSDREGHFLHSGRGMLLGSGSVYEDKNIERVRRFFQKAANEVYRVMRAYDVQHVYIFEPAYTKGAVTLALRPLARERIKLVRYGNYLHTPATLLLEFIERSNDQRPDPADPASVEESENAEEKRKILAHALEAQRVIGR